jgi:hypothetical protein
MEYLVTGPTRFRGHEPGTVFPANLPQDEHDRAVARGSVAVVKHKPIMLDAERVTLPRRTVG